MKGRGKFEIYLRTGKRPVSEPEIEAKFNPWHDPDNGRFTFANQGRHFGGGAPRSNERTQGPRAARPARQPKVKPILAAAPPGKPGPSQNSATYIGDLGRAVERIRHETGTARSRLRSIPGYSETGASSWRASNDRAFVDAANEFNRQLGLKPGNPKYVDPLLIKAWAMVESGGTKSVFLTDPLQVNVPADWADEKVGIAGLAKGQKMIPEASAKAALRWLEFKGYFRDEAGKPGPWIGFERALARYNGRSSLHSSGVPHNMWYAREVLRLYSAAKKLRDGGK